MRWRVLDKLLGCVDNFYSELKKRKAAPVGPSRKAGEIRKLDPSHDKCGRYLLGRYRDRPSVQKGTVLSARVLRTSPFTSTSGGASGMVVGFRE